MPSATPPLTLDAAEALIYEAKTWDEAVPELAWKKLSTKGFPEAYYSYNRLHPEDEHSHELAVECYYKPSILQGLPAALSLSLTYNHQRLLGVDSGMAGSHLNKSLHLPEDERLVGHPHLHRPAPGMLKDFAEALPASELADLWEDFLLLANLLEAPELDLPAAGDRLL
ncbi:hypothetical protein [Marinospirillum perlucidum]|uniref:hypothetical protein n=1 Tax=Marinospirillum perlucidum TaxID=1982602 RepID=UPI000DF14CBD|nr:hypothetical protein [Marinospirillum perlucidum]